MRENRSQRAQTWSRWVCALPALQGSTLSQKPIEPRFCPLRGGLNPALTRTLPDPPKCLPMSFIYSPLCNTAPQAENHRTTARRKRLTLLPMTGLCSGCHLPSRRGVANSKVSFELRPRQTLILKCLGQERPFLIRTECRSLPI